MGFLLGGPLDSVAIVHSPRGSLGRVESAYYALKEISGQTQLTRILGYFALDSYVGWIVTQLLWALDPAGERIFRGGPENSKIFAVGAK